MQITGTRRLLQMQNV